MNFIKKYLANRRLYRIAFALFAAFFVMLAFITYYGQNSGNFVMTIDDDGFKRGLVLCDSSEFTTHSQYLSASPVVDVMDTTYGIIEEELPLILQTDADYTDNKSRYLAYTFYVKNTGVENTLLYYKLSITDESRDLSKALRVLIVADGVVVDKDALNEIESESSRFYMAPDSVEHNYPSYMPTPIYFISDDVVCSERVENLRPEQSKKFTIVMWLEGEDPECNSNLYGAKIKMSLEFSVEEFDD